MTILEKLIERMSVIKNEMENELKSVNEDLIDYAILEEEINDTKYFLEEPCDERVQNIYNGTTSNRIYEAFKSFNNNIKRSI